MRDLLSKRQIVFAGTLFFVLVLGVSALFSRAEAAPCRCPLIYAPVICDHDRTYPNPCVANCHHAQNCVPTGIF